MGTKIGLQRCPCCRACGECTEFQKIADLKEAGLAIYRHVINIVHDVQETTAVIDDSRKFKDEVFILCNTKDHHLSSTDYVPELEKNKVSCPRCQYIVEHAQRLLKNVPYIEKKDVMGICDHCRGKQRLKTRCKCGHLAKQFADSQPRKTYEESKELVEYWIAKNYSHLKKVGSAEKKPSKYKGFLGSDISINVKHTEEHIPSTTRTEPDLDSRHVRDQDIERILQKIPERKALRLSKSPPISVETEEIKIYFEKVKSVDDIITQKADRKIKDRKDSIKTGDDIITRREDSKIKYSIKPVDGIPQREDRKIKDRKDGIEPVEEVLKKGIMKKIKPSLMESTLSSKFPLYEKETYHSFEKPSKVSEQFTFTFPKSISKKKKPKVKRLSSSQLVKETQDRIQIEIEEKNKKSEEKRQRDLKEKKLAREIKKKIAEERRNAEEEIQKSTEENVRFAKEIERDKEKEKAKKKEKLKGQKRTKTSSESDVETTVSDESKSKTGRHKAKEEKKKLKLRDQQHQNELEKLPHDKTGEEKAKIEKPEQVQKEKLKLQKPEQVSKEKHKLEKPEQVLKEKSEVDGHERSPKQKAGIDKREQSPKEKSEIDKSERSPKGKPENLKEGEDIDTPREKGIKKKYGEVQNIAATQRLKISKQSERESAKKDEDTEQKSKPIKPADTSGFLKKVLNAQAKAIEEEIKKKTAQDKDLILAHELTDEKTRKEPEIIFKKEFKKSHPKKSDLKKNKEETGKGDQPPEKEFVAKGTIKPRKPSQDDLILHLVKMKKLERPTKNLETVAKNKPLPIIVKRYKKRVKTSICLSDLELELDSLTRKKNLSTEKDADNDDVIIGQKIFKYRVKVDEKVEQVKPIIFKSIFNVEPVPETLVKPVDKILEDTKVSKAQLALTAPITEQQDTGKGIMRYILSDRTFIENGWTKLPTEKVVRKMNVYRMRPSRPEFDWFTRNKKRGLMEYNSGEKFAEFDKDGRCRWYYKNGRLALDYYNAEETNAQQRLAIYSNGEPDERGRSRPITLLATFDYSGNGVVFDHGGKIRLKYNQTEGIVLDRGLGPVSHWKWHTLNEPPVLQQVMIDTQVAHKDPEILEMGTSEVKLKQSENEEMLAIEFNNFLKEKGKKLRAHHKSFQIRMKALKINEHFSLRVMDQENIYLIYRDGPTNVKVNIGMILDPREIVDTDTAEVGEVSNSLERFPARSDSIAGLQRSVALAQGAERARRERDQRVRPPQPCDSVDRLAAATSRPLRAATAVPEQSNKCRKQTFNNLYCDTRIV